MDLNTLLKSAGIDTESSRVLVLRHSPKEPELFEVMPWLITEKPDVFNAYQQTQTPRVEKQMEQSEYIASFFGHETDKAAFVGVFRRNGERLITHRELVGIPEQLELVKYGLDHSGPKRKLFDLSLTKTLSDWQGKLIIDWPKPAIVWSRWADKNVFRVDAILTESVFTGQLSDWRSLVFNWGQLHLMPNRWQDVLAHWHGVYYIWDGSDGKGYVGAAYGKQGFYGRWINYKKSGHGGNKLLKLRKPDLFQFSILEWTSSDIEDTEIQSREALWKRRLHTRAPYGLNEN